MYLDFGELPIEVDTESLARGAWVGLEPDLTEWVNNELAPAVTNALEEAGPTIEDLFIESVIPVMKQELTPPNMTPYLLIGGAWSLGILAALWVIARNTGKSDARD